MIHEVEVKDLITTEIPELGSRLSFIPVKANAFKSIDCLTTYTKDLIRNGETTKAEQCFRTAYELLHQGSALVQLAIANIFVFSVSHMLEGSLTAAQSIRVSFLKNFGEEYSQQISSQLP
jgi:hypothetical protein